LPVTIADLGIDWPITHSADGRHLGLRMTRVRVTETVLMLNRLAD
jgi:hypothetical protein